MPDDNHKSPPTYPPGPPLRNRQLTGAWESIRKVPNFLLDRMLDRKLAKAPIGKAFWEFSRWIMPGREMGLKEWTKEIYKIA